MVKLQRQLEKGATSMAKKDNNTESPVSESIFPPLPIEEWEDAKNTFHIFMQIVGKIRLTLFPKKNHWWHVTLYLSPRGITTRPIPHGDIIFEIEFDLIDHELHIKSSDGRIESFGIEGLTVSEFYANLLSSLFGLGIDVSIRPFPYDLPFSKIPFQSDDQHSAYDAEYVNRFWRILLNVNSVFEEFRGRFIGKSTPVHLFWHHADLALTRFSGRPAPPMNGGTAADREAYSHEVISFGFWAGDENVREPAFYSYTYPEPEDLADEPLHPEGAYWNTDGGNSMALYMYNDMRKSDDPKRSLLEFLESAYRAGAKKANWEIEKLELRTVSAK